MVDAMEALAPADSALRRRPSPRQSLWPRRVETGMASFDSGAWRLLSDMIAQIHQGEMISPTSCRFRPQEDGRKQGRRRHGARPPFVGEPFVDSALIATLIDIGELGDRPSQRDAGILCILGSAFWIESTPSLGCSHTGSKDHGRWQMTSP
jgi:hypothetical protein